MKRHGLRAEARNLIKKDEDYSEYRENGETRRLHFRKGEAHFDAVIDCSRFCLIDKEGRTNEDTTKRGNFLLPNSFLEKMGREEMTVQVTARDFRRINLYPVETKAQLSRRVRQLNKLWPSQKAIEAATAKHNQIWWQFDLERAARELRRQKNQSRLRICVQFFIVTKSRSGKSVLEYPEARIFVAIARLTWFAFAM